MTLRDASVRNLTAEFFDAVRDGYPDSRESLRRTINRIISYEKKYWKSLSKQELNELATIHARFEDFSLGARLQQYVGPGLWDQEEQYNLIPIAEELISDHDVLAEHWPWLTSGNANQGWQLGEALAEVDPKGELAKTLPSLPASGCDLRLLCGYISSCRERFGDFWYDEWVTSQMQYASDPINLLFEVVWRCGVTELLANTISSTLRSEEVTQQAVGALAFGRWGENLSKTTLESVLTAMADTGHGTTAAEILRYRIKNSPDETMHWRPLALRLVTDPKLVRSDYATGFHWRELAEVLVADYPIEIAKAILSEQADRESSIWFAEHSQAAGILRRCVEQNPAGVWEVMQLHLSSPSSSYRYSIGFPQRVIESIPSEKIIEWIAGHPEDRASIVARLISTDMSTDSTLASLILGDHGDVEPIASAFLSKCISGAAASQWQQLAEALDATASRTTLPKLRIWASNSARKLRQMAKQTPYCEEEKALYGR